MTQNIEMCQTSNVLFALHKQKNLATMGHSNNNKCKHLLKAAMNTHNTKKKKAQQKQTTNLKLTRKMCVLRMKK